MQGVSLGIPEGGATLALLSAALWRKQGTSAPRRAVRGLHENVGVGRLGASFGVSVRGGCSLEPSLRVPPSLRLSTPSPGMIFSRTPGKARG